MACAVDLVDDVADIPGRQKLAFFDIDDSAGVGGGHEQRRLAAQERRNLNDVEHFGCGGDLFDRMDVADDRNIDPGPDLLQDFQPLVDARSCKGVD